MKKHHITPPPHTHIFMKAYFLLLLKQKYRYEMGFYTILYYLALSCAVLHYLALSCTILQYLALSCTILHYLALPCT